MEQIIAKYLLGVVLLWTVCKSDSLSVFPENNCTCVTSEGGFYSLWPLRRTDGKPRFLVAGGQYPGWRYTYNPCTPVDVGQDDPTASQICRDVALCKFAEIEKPREYFEIGLQKDFDCEINEEGQIQLVYKTHDRTIDIPHSRVNLHCDEYATIPVFKTEDEDNYIFSITHYCACPNRCPPGQKFEISSSEEVNTAIHSRQQSKSPGDGGIVPAMVGLGAIVSVILGVFLYWKYRAERQPSESRQPLIEETKKREKNMFI